MWLPVALPRGQRRKKVLTCQTDEERFWRQQQRAGRVEVGSVKVVELESACQWPLRREPSNAGEMSKCWLHLNASNLFALSSVHALLWSPAP